MHTSSDRAFHERPRGMVPLRYSDKPASSAALPDPLDLYERAGGLETCDALACLLRPHVAQPVSVVAHWLVDRKIIAFDWRARTFVPLFQFTLHDMSPRDDVQRVVAMLAPVFDASQLALWFVQPNTSLAGCTPLETFQRGPSPALLGLSPRQVAVPARP